MLALAGIIVAPIDKTLLILPRRELSGHKVELKGKKDNINIFISIVYICHQCWLSMSPDNGYSR